MAQKLRRLLVHGARGWAGPSAEGLNYADLPGMVLADRVEPLVTARVTVG